jgi:acetyltransferase-like isoleucine patch superfamily enzyme/dTDP-4-dehydrorhamnose 3,5-epimerase-like enzyme
LNYFVHPNGLCETTKVGDGTRIWAFTHLLDGAVIGRDCNICDHVFIEDQVVIGDRVTVKSGVQLWNGIIVEDDVFIGPNATFSNDRFPRSKQYQTSFPVTTICRHASIGAGATILPGLTVGHNAMIGAGSVVTSNVQPNAIVTGNPARVTGYVDAKREAATFRIAGTLGDTSPSVAATTVKGVTLHKLKRVEDIRGNLLVGEFTRELPFAPARFFTIFDVPGTRVRGEHAHRTCEQFLICLRGSCAIVVEDGRSREEIVLGNSDYGIYICPVVWTTLYNFTVDAILLVFASAFYDPDDYIRDYTIFLKAVTTDAAQTVSNRC